LWFLLALALGGRTVAEWQDVMSSEEFSEWAAYYELNPFGPKRADYQAAVIARTIAQANAPKGKTFQIKDFVLEFKTRTEQDHRMSGEQIISFFKGLQGT
jgi:hypothetical protein